MRPLLNIGAVLLLVACGMHTATTSTSRVAERSPELPPMAHIQFCRRHPADCVAKGGTQPVSGTNPRLRELAEINQTVNSTIVPIEVDETGVEQWNVSPAQGDCNDYAVTKQHALLRKGWPSGSVLLTEVVLRSTRQHHLILVAKTSAGDYILDNLENALLPVAQAKSLYSWVRMQSTENPKLWKAVEVDG